MSFFMLLLWMVVVGSVERKESKRDFQTIDFNPKPIDNPYPTGCSLSDFRTIIAANVDRSDTKVLVTGAGGFIGSHVADFCLLQMNFTVVAVDDLSGGFKANLDNFIANGGEFIVGDLKQREFVTQLFSERGPFTYVYHLAAYATVGLSHFPLEANYENNLVASTYLINAAVDQVPQVETIVFTSSVASYGNSDGKLPLTETSPQVPEGPFGVAKLGVEMALKTAHEMSGLNYVIFRPHNVYGPRQSVADKFGNILGVFMKQLMFGEGDLAIFGDGSQLTSFTYIDDVVPLIAGSPLFSIAQNNDYFVGNDERIDVKSLVYEIIAAANISRGIRFLEAQNEMAESAYLSHEKLRCHFNPPSSKPLKDGLEITANFVSSHRRSLQMPTKDRHIEEAGEEMPSRRTYSVENESSARHRHHVGSDHRGGLGFGEHRKHYNEHRYNNIQRKKEEVDVVVFIPAPADRNGPARRSLVNKQFVRDFTKMGWDRSKVVVVWVVGSKTGEELENDIDVSLDDIEKEPHFDESYIELLVTDCRDYGDASNNPNGTSSTTCKVYRALQFIERHYIANYAIRGADDAYLNLRLFFELMPVLPSERLYMGSEGNVEQPLLRSHGQDKIAELFGIASYSKHYMTGMGYVLSWDVVDLIGNWNISPHLVYIEDQLIGFWISIFDILHVSRQDLFIHRAGSSANMYPYDWTYGNVTAIIMHYMRPNDWDNIEEGGSIVMGCETEGLQHCGDPYVQPYNLQALLDSF